MLVASTAIVLDIDAAVSFDTTWRNTRSTSSSPFATPPRSVVTSTSVNMAAHRCTASPNGAGCRSFGVLCNLMRKQTYDKPKATDQVFSSKCESVHTPLSMSRSTCENKSVSCCTTDVNTNNTRKRHTKPTGLMDASTAGGAESRSSAITRTDCL